MPFVKIVYASPNNVGVKGTEYIEIYADELDENGGLPEDTLTAYWQEAVNEYMADTYVGVVEREGD